METTGQLGSILEKAMETLAEHSPQDSTHHLVRVLGEAVTAAYSALNPDEPHSYEMKFRFSADRKLTDDELDIICAHAMGAIYNPVDFQDEEVSDADVRIKGYSISEYAGPSWNGLGRVVVSDREGSLCT